MFVPQPVLTIMPMEADASTMKEKRKTAKVSLSLCKLHAASLVHFIPRQLDAALTPVIRL